MNTNKSNECCKTAIIKLTMNTTTKMSNLWLIRCDGVVLNILYLAVRTVMTSLTLLLLIILL